MGHSGIAGGLEFGFRDLLFCEADRVDLGISSGSTKTCLGCLKLYQSWLSLGDGIDGAETVFG